MKIHTKRLLLNLATGFAIACTAAVVLTPASAFAAPAEATTSVTVRAAPSTRAPAVDRLYAGEDVDVKGCRSGWCYIVHSGPDGYVSSQYLTRSSGARMDPNFNLSFNFPNGSFSIGTGGVSIGVGPGDGRPDRSEVCFYEDNNYHGAAFCMNPGESRRQLTGPANDRISSIRNPDGLRVTVCEDWNFSGSCRTYTSNARSLPGFNDVISSIRVR